ncbi:hypothetical protein ElyMa_004790500 [Elysia marginata]|uniref:Uncharacterized protein n=1 Tax=Elysia marginata TaxID=1093978 RepID=A0AAV4ILS8_9GAST|nr:hypothetical protein ElyMa_004790500 [Elysia marginata]
MFGIYLHEKSMLNTNLKSKSNFTNFHMLDFTPQYPGLKAWPEIPPRGRFEVVLRVGILACADEITNESSFSPNVAVFRPKKGLTSRDACVVDG